MGGEYVKNKMKEYGEKLVEQKEKDDAVMNLESYRAQEAIRDPNLPDELKDEVVGEAIEKILTIAEVRNAYDDRQKATLLLSQLQTIYQAK